MPGQCLVPFGVGDLRIPQAESTTVDARRLLRVNPVDGRHWPGRAEEVRLKAQPTKSAIQGGPLRQATGLSFATKDRGINPLSLPP